jgi:GntR family transcriptional regulator / MocR family aminotransferase
VELFLDPLDGRGMASQLYDQLRNAVTDGRLVPGDRLPPTRTVAGELGIARSTVTTAYERLIAEGFVEGRSGGGTVVVSGPWPRTARPDVRLSLAPTPEAARTRRYGENPEARAAFDLSPGRTDPRLFPEATWRRCVVRALSAAAGAYGDPAGSAQLRRALARWVTQSRGVTADPEEIVVTSGAGHAVDILARVLLRPGDVAAVEEPGYPPVTQLLRTHGVTVVGVPVDDEGIVVDAIPSAARLVHVTPSHQFPLGTVMSRNRRLQLLEWAGRHSSAVIEDDYDSEFRYTARPLEPLHRLDRDGRVLYVGTFSKMLSPAIRMGFAVVPAALMPTVRAVRQAVDWGPPAVADAAMAAFIDEGHLAAHLRRARKVYRDRHELLQQSLRRLERNDLRVLPSQAGLHVTVLADRVPPDRELSAGMSRLDLLVGSLRLTYQFSAATPGLVVGFGALRTEQVPAGVARVSSLLG